jgi:isopenicillin-N epimerase
MSQGLSNFPFGHRMRGEWQLDPEITYLNHGTVGATPTRVLMAQQAIRDEIERQPARYLLRELSEISVGVSQPEWPRLRQAAEAVAAFVGVKGSDLVFVDNATAGINAVLRSFDFEPGDEILITDLAYGAVANTAAYVARERGARLVTATTPYPIKNAQLITEAIEKSLTPKTRVAIIDHISSESALLLPVVEIAELCQEKNVAILVDGAHTPGMIPLNISELNVDWYVANLHKWAWAPRSCGFLWAKPERQRELHPPVISWGLDKGYTAEFDWVGTRDPSPYLAAPAAIQFMTELGIDAIRTHNHHLAWNAATLLAQSCKTTLSTPKTMIGSMATVPLPPKLGATKEAAFAVRDKLLFEKKIEVQVHPWHGQLWVRLSAQIYNELSDFEKLARAVLSIA